MPQGRQYACLHVLPPTLKCGSPLCNTCGLSILLQVLALAGRILWADHDVSCVDMSYLDQVDMKLYTHPVLCCLRATNAVNLSRPSTLLVEFAYVSIIEGRMHAAEHRLESCQRIGQLFITLSRKVSGRHQAFSPHLSIRQGSLPEPSNTNTNVY